jgi:hypothetical protein
LTQSVLFEDDTRGATFSPCGSYRYRLWRPTGLPRDRRDRRVLWVMLNPSTADESTDDATIRRIIGFSRGWGYWRLDVCNLFAYRATNPVRLVAVDDPVGPENDRHIGEVALAATDVVLGWGDSLPPGFDTRPAEVLRLMSKCPIWCLARTASGQPHHPLRLPKDLDMMRWVL